MDRDRVLAEDLDRVLVGADRAVGAEAVEHGAEVSPLRSKAGVVRQAGAADVVDDADREAVARGTVGAPVRRARLSPSPA
jgi:hypothetical protein